MTNVNVEAIEVLPQAGADNEGYKLGRIKSGVKAAQNDTWTVSNASLVDVLSCTLDATGAAEIHTAATNVITLASVTATACSALIRYK